jgi:D-alanyl-D-alanine carboxypeptidase
MRRLIRILILVGCSSLACAPSMQAQPSRDLSPAEKLKVLLAAYPQTLASAQGNEITFTSGARLPFDDSKRNKSFEALLAHPDIEDMFAIRYPLGRAQQPPALNSDPGRIRNAAFFRAMYGDCTRGEVTRNLVDVVWLPKRPGTRVKITRINGVAERLAAVSRELDALPDAFMKYLTPIAGTYNCRSIAGTERASAHGFGIAIDLAVAHAHYWRWTKPAAAGRYAYRNAIPAEIVAIFEKHGFIWGGKWYHYDTMHFEYRPEILAAARL